MRKRKRVRVNALHLQTSLVKLLPLRFAFAVLLAHATALCAQERVLTTALEVRSLTPAEADQGIAVQLRGVVVFIEGLSAVFVQDETSTTFFRVRARPLPTIGDEIELSGKTRMGLYQPGLDYSTYRVVGRRPLPAGIRASYDDLYFGRYHYQRVIVEGVVRSVVPFENEKSLMTSRSGRA